jgi:transcriptional regulator with XRE-family HTH domain
MKKEPEIQNPLADERDPFLVALGERVRELRVSQGLTQKALAAKCGSSQAHIFVVEAGAQNVGIGAVLKIAKALGVTPGDLLLETPEEAPSKVVLDRILRSHEDIDRRISAILGHIESIIKINEFLSPMYLQLKAYLEREKNDNDQT